MPKYRYTGDIEISLPKIGLVKPGQTVESSEIDHPLFKIVKKTKKTRKKK
jgi:hypothetical protein